MSGLESVAAIIGITDAAFRRISLLYKTFEDWKTVPREVQNLKRELSGLHHRLPQLRELNTTDEKTLSAIKGFELQEVLEWCTEACEPLRVVTQTSPASTSQDWRVRLQIILDKKDTQ